MELGELEELSVLGGLRSLIGFGGVLRDQQLLVRDSCARREQLSLVTA